MSKETMTIQTKDGASRVYDERGKLVSVDGVPVKKTAPPADESESVTSPDKKRR